MDLASAQSDPATAQWVPPVKRSAAGAVFTNLSGQVLLVKPTYRTTWNIPGGVVEEGEPPEEACRREIAEELGLDVSIGRWLSLDWIPPRDDLIDGYAFIFEGGVLDPAAIAEIRLPPRELSDIAFVDPTAASTRLGPGLARRLTVSLSNRDSGNFSYLNDGLPVA